MIDDRILALSNAPPCAKCGAEVVLDRFNEETGIGTVRCRSCDHTFKVKTKPPAETPDDLHQG